MIQKVNESEEDVAMKYKGKSDLCALHPWQKDLPQEIEAVLKEFEDIFPKDLPLDFHLSIWNMNSKLI